MKNELIQKYLDISCDLNNCLHDLDLNRQESFQNLIKQKPEKTEAIQEFFNSDFWEKNFILIKKSYSDEIDEIMNEEEISSLIRFFETPLGQKYLQLKNRLQSRQAKSYQVISAMQKSYSRIVRSI